MKALTKLLAALVLAGTMGTASATLLSFGFTGFGNYTVNTGDISALTTSKTIPLIELVNTIATPVSAALAGIASGTSVTLSTYTLQVAPPGPAPFSIAAGLLTFSFSNLVSSIIVPTVGITQQGSISLQFTGFVTGDLSVGTTFLGQTVTLSETCTQTQAGASITCSESVQTPGVPRQVPEPMSLALLGIGLVALGVVRRRKI